MKNYLLFLLLTVLFVACQQDTKVAKATDKSSNIVLSNDAIASNTSEVGQSNEAVQKLEPVSVDDPNEAAPGEISPLDEVNESDQTALEMEKAAAEEAAELARLEKVRKETEAELKKEAEKKAKKAKKAKTPPAKKSSELNVEKPKRPNTPKSPPPLKEKKSGAVLKFDQLEQDYGFITEGDKIVKEFTFTNSGTTPLIIENATAACGCTVPEFPLEPIPPGGKNTIKVTFDSKGKVGVQNKEITIFANTSPKQTKVMLKGIVVK